MTVIDIRSSLLARRLHTLGLQPGRAAYTAGAIALLATNGARLAVARDALREHGINPSGARLLLERAGMLEGEACAFCSRVIPERACRVTLHSRPYCNESCCLDAVDAGLVAR